MKRICALFMLIVITGLLGISQERMDDWTALLISLKGVRLETPKKGFVPNEATAIRIGEAVAMAQYGEAKIIQERPFRARLYGDTWLVQGTLHPAGADGGTAVVKISRKSGQVLLLIHQK